MSEWTGSVTRKMSDLREGANRVVDKAPPNTGNWVGGLSFLPLLFSLGMVFAHEIQHVEGGLAGMMTTEFVGSAIFAVCHEGLAWVSGAGVATGVALRMKGK